MITLSDGKSVADIGGAIGVASVDYQVGAVSELSIPGVDDGSLSRAGLLVPETTLRYAGAPWEVAAIERDYRDRHVFVTIQARSRLARRLRAMTGPKRWGKATPAEFIGNRAKAAGGRAYVEPGARRRAIVQKRDQSVLDVIGALASDTGVEWVEFDNRIIVATPWHAFKQGIPGLPTWPLRVTGAKQTALSFSTRESIDDREAAAEAQVTVPNSFGLQLRPFHRMIVAGATDEDDGLWLVRSVQFELRDDAAASVTLQRPLKSAPKKGSTSGSDSAGAGSGGSIEVEGEWIANADKRGRNCTRTPRQYVAWAKSRVGTPYENYRCLRWVSEAVSGTDGRGGKYARFVWENAPAGTPKDPGNTKPPIGAIVVWNQPTGGVAGHIGISIGGGKMISATGGSVGVQTIATFGRAGSYYGAMAPDFWV